MQCFKVLLTSEVITQIADWTLGYMTIIQDPEVQDIVIAVTR